MTNGETKNLIHMIMNMQDYAKQLNETDQKEILETLSNIEEEGKKTDTYKQKDLGVLFKYWEKIYPNNKPKMSMDCGGCRKAVHKFFFNLSSHFSTE